MHQLRILAQILSILTHVLVTVHVLVKIILMNVFSANHAILLIFGKKISLARHMPTLKIADSRYASMVDVRHFQVLIR